MFTKDDIICTDKYLALESSTISYMKTDLLTHGRKSMVWRGKDHTARPAKVWITGHSDYPITENLFNRYQHNCEKWFAINKEVDHPKIVSLPLGITNYTNESPDHPIYGNTDIMIDVMSTPRVIKNLAYMNFSIRTCTRERQPCFDMFKDKSWVTVGTSVNTLEGRRIFLQELRNHTFVICPRGNGVDTHRLWETLYMGSIPIVKRHITVNDFTDLPILFIDDWSEVTEEMLREKYTEITAKNWNMEKLTAGYWGSLIKRG